MIVILNQDEYTNIAEAIRTDLITAFADQISVGLIRADVDSQWPADPSWDDLLIILYDGKRFPDSGSRFISDYIKQHPEPMLLPVAIDIAARKPPDAAAGIKALPYDDKATGAAGTLANRVGAMLGLRIQGRDSKIFISYRASDGTAIANQLYQYLVSAGHRPFLDEARELDGQTTILPGSPVQDQIDEALKQAKLMLLIDTPQASNSLWITHEIQTADGFLLPILPISLRDPGDRRLGPRFRSLVALQRWVPLTRTPNAKPPLSEAQLELIQNEAELYMCEIFKRKLRVPFIVEKEFSTRGFVWEVLDKQLLMFGSSKSRSKRLQTKVLSHCALFDPFYTPAMKRFAAFLKARGQSNFNLFIYDGELIAEPELEELIKDESNIIILHHQELAALIDSNFTMVGAP